jgi:hypothetical protein
MLFARKERTLVGPPSWKRSEKTEGPDNECKIPARAPRDKVYSITRIKQSSQKGSEKQVTHDAVK